MEKINKFIYFILLITNILFFFTSCKNLNYLFIEYIANNGVLFHSFVFTHELFVMRRIYLFNECRDLVNKLRKKKERQIGKV